MITRKITLGFSGVITLLFAISMYIGAPRLCAITSFNCINLLFDFEIYSLIFVPVFIFSIITYFTNITTFQVWSKFALVWIILSIISIFTTKEMTGNMLFSMDKSFVSIILSGLFVFLSIIIIVIKSLFPKKQ